MIVRPAKNDPVWNWIDGCVNQTLTPDELSQLQERLATDPQARLLFLDYCELHGSLWFDVHTSAALNQATETVGRLESNRSMKFSRLRSLRGLALAIAASLALVGIGAWVLKLTRGDSVAVNGQGQIHSATANDSMSHIERRALATVTGLSDCKWNGTPYEQGGEVKEGATIQIDEGVLHLTFENGVEIVIEGPARVTVASDSRCEVDYGMYAVTVPKRALGFTIETNTAEALGLESEFGLQASRDQALSIHTFSGEVVVWPLDHQQIREREMHVSAGNSITSSAAHPTEFKFGEAEPRLFKRAAISRPDDPSLSVLPVQQHLALWLAADGLMTLDDQNRVAVWRDVLEGDNRTNEDAWQRDPECRPHFVRDAFGIKPGLRFNGTSNYLETTPLLTTEDQTLFFVFSRASDFKQPKTHAESLRTSRQLINYNGPVHDPNKARAQTFERHELQICDRLSPGVYWGRVFATVSPDKPGMHLGSVIAQKPVAVGQPVVLAYAYHPSTNNAMLMINGVLQGSDSAPLARRFTSSKVIGRSCAFPAFFHGDIAEILIYNGALSTAQIVKVDEYLGTKYRIQVSTVLPNLAQRKPAEWLIPRGDDDGPVLQVRRDDTPEEKPKVESN